LKMKSQNGLLPLHEACLEGQTQAVHLLLALGSDVNAKTAVGVFLEDGCMKHGQSQWYCIVLNCRRAGRL
jgi:ankyrin repeat protein